MATSAAPASMGSLLSSKLAALGYPHSADFSVADGRSGDPAAAALVLWLENRKIRQYAPDARGDLAVDAAANPAKWRSALYKYLADLVRCVGW